MAKPLSAKSVLIRDAIRAHPDLNNKPLAELINSSDARKEDKIQVTALDVAQQRQALKNLEKEAEAPAPKAVQAASRDLPAPPPDPVPHPVQPAPTPLARAKPVQAINPVEVIDRVFELAEACGGFQELKKLVDKIALVEARL